MVFQQSLHAVESDDSSTDEEMEELLSEDGDPDEQQLIETEHERDENGGQSEDSDTDLKDEFDADDSDHGKDDESEEEISGWADAMAKVLRAGKDNDKPILSKAKKDYETISKSSKEESTKKPGSTMSVIKARQRRKERDLVGRKKPDPLERNRERTLSKVATKGVVQLFNAVREHQKSLKTQLNEAGKSTKRREKVFSAMNKDKFMNTLSGSGRNVPASTSSQNLLQLVPKPEDTSETWSVLKDGYMMGAKMKDWDKDSD